MIKQYRVKINDRNFIVKAENQRQAVLKVKAVKDHNNNVIFESSNNSPFDAKLQQLCRKYYRNNN